MKQSPAKISGCLRFLPSTTMHYTLSLSVNTERPLENKNRRRHSPDNHSLLRLPSASRCIKIPLLLLLSLIKIAENCTFQKIGKQNFSSPPQMLHELYVDRYMHGKQFRKRHFLQPPPNTVEEPADVYLKACSVNMGNSGWTLAVRLSALYVWETTCFVRAWTQLETRVGCLHSKIAFAAYRYRLVRARIQSSSRCATIVEGELNYYRSHQHSFTTSYFVFCQCVSVGHCQLDFVAYTDLPRIHFLAYCSVRL